MKEIHVTIRADRLNLPLETAAVGVLSSAVLVVGGDVPDDIETLAVRVEYMDAQTKREYSAAGTRISDNGYAEGCWRVYLAPAYFPAAAENLKYHVIGIDGHGNPRWLGTGNLRILANPANGSADTPAILPPMSYAYNPLTGLYHKLVAEVNAYGEISVAVDQEGVEL